MSDRDPIFLSTLWRQLTQFGGTKLHCSSAYHPQSDGQTEVVNHCLEQYLHAFTFDYPNQWSFYLSWVELCYNTTFHTAIGMTPHQALYGVNPKLLSVYNPGSTFAEEVDLALMDCQQLQQQLQEHITRAQTRIKRYVDSKRVEKSFDVG